MAKASKLTKVTKFLESKGFDAKVKDRYYGLISETSVEAVKDGVKVYVSSTKGLKYLTVIVSVDGEVMGWTVDDILAGHSGARTQNDAIRDIIALLEKAEIMQQIKIEAQEAETYEAQAEEIAVVEAEGRTLFQTVKKAFPHLQVVNPFTTIKADNPALTNYNFDVVAGSKRNAMVRIYTNEIHLVTFSENGVDTLHFEPKQHDDVIQALEAHFPNQLTAEALEAEGLQVVEDIQEAIYITPEGVLIGGEFDCGARGVDHRIISYLVPVKPYEDHTAFWNYVHENLGLVRLVPETGMALIGQKQVLTDVQIDKLMRTNYTIEQY